MPSPRSPLFPSTTLFRSVRTPDQGYWRLVSATCWSSNAVKSFATWTRLGVGSLRSEEGFSRNAEPEISTLSLHDALPICQNTRPGVLEIGICNVLVQQRGQVVRYLDQTRRGQLEIGRGVQQECRARDLHSFPPRRSSDLSEHPTRGTGDWYLQRAGPATRSSRSLPGPDSAWAA